uniref:DUF2428 domain-containing protein n=1 Tax=Macrostomum lignano TaxID=282301 RepID=A0A1I8FEV0_9PLAT
AEAAGASLSQQQQRQSPNSSASQRHSTVEADDVRILLVTLLCQLCRTDAPSTAAVAGHSAASAAASSSGGGGRSVATAAAFAADWRAGEAWRSKQALCPELLPCMLADVLSRVDVVDLWLKPKRLALCQHILRTVLSGAYSLLLGGAAGVNVLLGNKLFDSLFQLGDACLNCMTAENAALVATRCLARSRRSAAIRRLAGQPFPEAAASAAACVSLLGSLLLGLKRCRVQLAHLSRCRRRGHRLCNYSFYAHHHCDAFVAARIGQRERVCLAAELASLLLGLADAPLPLSCPPSDSQLRQPSRLPRPPWSLWTELVPAAACPGRLGRPAAQAGFRGARRHRSSWCSRCALRQATGSVLLECRESAAAAGSSASRDRAAVLLRHLLRVGASTPTMNCLAKPMELLSLYTGLVLNSDAATACLTLRQFLRLIKLAGRECKAEFLRLALLAAAAGAE